VGKGEGQGNGQGIECTRTAACLEMGIRGKSGKGINGDGWKKQGAKKF